MIRHVLNACSELLPERIIVVVSPNAKQIIEAVAPTPCVVQDKPLGTGDAVKAARKALEGFQGDILILYADSPLISIESLNEMRRKRFEAGSTIVLTGFWPQNAGSYGRLVTDTKGNLIEIVEASEATPEQRAIKLCNGGIMLYDAQKLWGLLAQLRDNNAKKEFFLTDCIALAHRAGDLCSIVEISPDEILGANTRVELAQIEKIMQQRLRKKVMLGGTTLIDPDTVYLSFDTKIGRDVVIEPNVVIGEGVEIADHVTIRAFSHIEKTRIQACAIIGPFARLRPGSTIGPNAHIGNFVEIKKSDIGQGAKVNHLSYVGDATIGTKANIGAGTIMANYDGFGKYHTHIGAGVYTGANSVFVAPLTVGEGAYIGAGSVITNDVPANALAVARGRQENREDWARRMREQKTRDKNGQ